MRVDVTQRPLPHLTSISQATGWIGDTLTLSGTELSGSSVVVKIANVSASIVSRANDRVVVTAPSVGKKKRKAGAQPVVLIRDGVQSDSTLWFDYVKPTT
jgi:hypothetical protein